MIKTLRAFVAKEIAQTFHDPRMRMAMFYIPLFQLLVYGLALSTYTQNVRLAIVTRPDDHFTRRLSQRLYSSGWFVAADVGEGDPVEWLQSGAAEAVLVAPPEGAQRRLGRAAPRFQLLIDSVNAERARSIENYVSSIVQQALNEERWGGSPPRFRFAVRTLFNPERNTSIYLLPGTICVLLFLAMTALTSMSMGREKELGTIETILAAPISPWEVLIGKTFPFVVLGMIELPFGLLFAKFVGVPIRGSMWLIELSTLIFLTCAVACGFLISMRVRNQQQAVFSTFMFNFPLVQLSGIVFPVENMPKAIAWFAYINPLHYYVDVMRHLMLKGDDYAAILPKLGAMGLLGVAAMLAVIVTFRQTMN